MSNINGIDLFKSNKKENIESIVESIEKSIDVVIPESFKFFLFLFELGEGKFNIPYQNYDGYLIPEFEIKIKTSLLRYHQEIVIDYFYDLNRILEEWTSCTKDDHFKNDQVLPIGITEVPKGRIYVSLSNLNLGEILCDHDDSENYFQKIKIAKNIFELIKSMYLASESINLSSPKYYKNWGEDYWRVEDIDKP